MSELQVYQLASGRGYAAEMHGNIVNITADGKGFSALVFAHPGDVNVQYESFDTAVEAVAWCAATSAAHQCQPGQYSKVEYWEVRHGYSITISLTESGEYQPDRLPVWVDSDHYPVLQYAERFQERDAALDWIRQRVDEESQGDADYQGVLLELKDALDSQHLE